MHDKSPTSDVVVIGGGQAGLAVGYYLRRTGLDFIILDGQDAPSGAWQHGWDSLRLFSPAEYSSLPGWQMPRAGDGGFPTRDEVIDYLARYEARYDLPIKRPIRALRVLRDEEALRVETDAGVWRGRAVVSATGTWEEPHVPRLPGQDLFRGVQIHSAQYQTPVSFVGLRVLVVGGGNSGVQIVAEVSKVAETSWVTLGEPVFLPDDVDGRVLFERASARILGASDGSATTTLGDIVLVPQVKEARKRGALKTIRPFEGFTETGVVWQDGRATPVDAVIWCTGFRPATNHLRSLGIVDADQRVEVVDQRSVKEPRLWLAGYGNWTGAASATLIGAGRTARMLVPQIEKALFECSATS